MYERFQTATQGIVFVRSRMIQLNTLETAQIRQPTPRKEKMEVLGEVQKTERGFEIIEFSDYNNEECSLQVSSIIFSVKNGVSGPVVDCVWLGRNEARMHLTSKQAVELAKRLLIWAEHGTFKG